MNDVRIEGDRVVMRRAGREDMEAKVRWYNDPAVNKTLLVDEEFDLDRTLAWFDAHRDDASRLDLVIEDKQGQAIGFAGLVHIDRKNGTAECFCVIGEKAFWGKGLGTEVHRVLIDWAFKTLGLHKIWADIRAENTAIVKVIERLGFRVEGTLRQEKLVGGKRIDVVRVGLLRDEFYAACPELC